MDGTLLTGSTTFQNPEVLAGKFLAATGGVNGVLDANDNGTMSANSVPFTATYTAADGNGRGTLALTSPSLTNLTWNFAYYVVSAQKVLLIQTDTQSNPLSNPPLPALAGTAELQSQATFSDSDVLNKSYVFLLERSASSGLFGAAGKWTFETANTVTGEMDINKLGASANTTIYKPLGGPNAAYAVGLSGNGRGTVTIPSAATTPAAPSLSSAVFYLISPGKMY